MAMAREMIHTKIHNNVFVSFAGALGFDLSVIDRGSIGDMLAL